MADLHGKQQKMLDLLLTVEGGATTDELAAHLGISKSATRAHLRKIQHLGYLSFVDQKGEVGRPLRRYVLSPDGHETFPRRYSWLTNNLLALLAEELGDEAVGALMSALADKVVKSLAVNSSPSESDADMLSRITRTLNELGYRATLKQSDMRKGAVIEATNCVYHTVAVEHPKLCQFDTRLLEQASGLQVHLECCIAKGSSVCRFGLQRHTLPCSDSAIESRSKPSTPPPAEGTRVEFSKTLDHTSTANG